MGGPSVGAMRGKSNRTNTARAIFRSSNGDLMAVPHRHELTGYKLSDKHGELTKFHSVTIYRELYKPPTALSGTKELVPYSPHARRSQLPMKYIGQPDRYTRYGGVWSTDNINGRRVHDRNRSQVVIGDRRLLPESSWKPVSHTFYKTISEHDKIVASHPSTFSTWTKRHRQ